MYIYIYVPPPPQRLKDIQIKCNASYVVVMWGAQGAVEMQKAAGTCANMTVSAVHLVCGDRRSVNTHTSVARCCPPCTHVTFLNTSLSSFVLVIIS